mmetsp:Transcript_56744/g.143787  ORF Transcript_56744/g.143787 Transcript_56744/m.143787 type:complete len:115 (+) Transcript_56744:996-1340(+)
MRITAGGESGLSDEGAVLSARAVAVASVAEELDAGLQRGLPRVEWSDHQRAVLRRRGKKGGRWVEWDDAADLALSCGVFGTHIERLSGAESCPKVNHTTSSAGVGRAALATELV